jgi:hypothetical protein
MEAGLMWMFEDVWCVCVGCRERKCDIPAVLTSILNTVNPEIFTNHLFLQFS